MYIPCTFHWSLRAKRSNLLVFSKILWAGLAISRRLKKKQKIFFFFSFPKKFLVGTFLVIGVKQGKSSGIGEKIKRFKSESGQVEKE